MSDAGSDIEHIIPVGFHTVTIGLHKVRFSMYSSARELFKLLLF